MSESIDKVIAGGYCIGCGACAYKSDEVKIEFSEMGFYQAKISRAQKELDEVCPFFSGLNENKLGELLYANCDDIQFDERIGYYSGLYAGYAFGETRERGSSGGVTTWVLLQLLESGKIDGVIHVGAAEDQAMFGYTVSHSVEEVVRNSKSRYYPVHFDHALKRIDSGKRYAFVGVPCHVKAMRLLCQEDRLLQSCIKYFIGIFCGHMKTAAFAELLAWQAGVKPEDLKEVDFRVKGAGLASSYGVRIESTQGSSFERKNSKLYGTDWGLGFFKPKACDWCDDIAAEVADMACGDAWLPKYVHDGRGTNVVIVRNPDIQKILIDARSSNSIYLDELSCEEVVKSQAGNFRHRREGLSVRAGDADAMGIWHPAKRIFARPFEISSSRKDMYRLRSKLSEMSHIKFAKAKKLKSLMYFFLVMTPVELSYYKVAGNFKRAILRKGYYFFRLLGAGVKK